MYLMLRSPDNHPELLHLQFIRFIKKHQWFSFYYDTPELFVSFMI